MTVSEECEVKLKSYSICLSDSEFIKDLNFSIHTSFRAIKNS